MSNKTGRVEMVHIDRLNELQYAAVVNNKDVLASLTREEMGRIISEVIWSRSVIDTLKNIVADRPVPAFPKGSKHTHDLEAFETLRGVTLVSYDGKTPNLCKGTLVFRVQGETYEWTDCLQSGGGVSMRNNDMLISRGPWEINAPVEYRDEPWLDTLETLVNRHIPHGCCGGCA